MWDNMCEDKKTCNWYDRKGWKEQNDQLEGSFTTSEEFAMKFLEFHLFGSTSLECPCCCHFVDPDGNCGNCGWKNILLVKGLI